MNSELENITNNTRLTPLTERQTTWLNQYNGNQSRLARIRQIETYASEQTRLESLRPVNKDKMRTYIRECAESKSIHSYSA